MNKNAKCLNRGANIRVETGMIIFLIGILLFIYSSAFGAGVSRTLSRSSLNGGETLDVTISIDVDPDHHTYGFDEKYPTGWNVLNSEGYSGTYGHIKQFTLDGASDQTIAYSLTAPSIPGIYYFSGSYNFGIGNDQLIAGDNMVIVNADPSVSPQVLGTYPTNKKDNIRPSQEIWIIFNKDMNKDLTETNVTITPAADYTSRWENNVLIFTPLSSLSNGTEYTVLISANAQDVSGRTLDGNMNGLSENNLDDDYVFSFKIEEAIDRASIRRYFNKSIINVDEVLEVLLVVNVSQSARYYIISDNFPDGWTLVDVDWERDSDLIRILNLAATPGTHFYRYWVKPPEATGVYNFSGEYAMDSPTENIGGQSEVIVVDKNYCDVNNPEVIAYKIPFNDNQYGVCRGSKKTCGGESVWMDDHSGISELESLEVSCGDEMDNDCDDAVDCADQDCEGMYGCEFATELSCSDNIDNDGDAVTDCDDPDCDGVSECEHRTERSCFDGINNDADYFVDCEDYDCEGITGDYCDTGKPGICAAGSKVCSNGAEICQQNIIQQAEEAGVGSTCSDEVDNDCDGFIDGDDSDCRDCPRNVWQTKADVLPKRAVHTSAVLGGKVYIIGGHTSVTGYRKTVEAYDPLTNTWDSSIGSLETSRAFAAASVHDGKIYVFGGYDGSNALKSVEVYNPETNLWTALNSDMKTTRMDHCVTPEAVNGIIYIVGGYQQNTIYGYDPSRNMWIEDLPPMKQWRHRLTCAVDKDKIYVIGGDSGGDELDHVEVFDTITKTWKSSVDGEVTPMPTARTSLASSVIDGKIYVLGGFIRSATPRTESGAVEVYDPVADRWDTNFLPLNTLRSSFTASTVNDKIYLIGGNQEGIGNLIRNEEMRLDTDGDCIPNGNNPCRGGNVTDCDDNCTFIYNPDQADEDSDGVGDMCDNLLFGIIKGFNLISAPSNTTSIPDAYMCMEVMDSSGAKLGSLSRYDRQTGVVQKAYYGSDASKGGENFPIIPGEGLVAYANQDMSVELLQANCPTFDLKAGKNWVGTPCDPSHSTAFELLKAIGDETVITGIQRFNSVTGEFETALYQNGQPAGSDFPINAGEGYFIYMKADRAGFQP